MSGPYQAHTAWPSASRTTSRYAAAPSTGSHSNVGTSPLKVTEWTQLDLGRPVALPCGAMRRAILLALGLATVGLSLPSGAAAPACTITGTNGDDSSGPAAVT